MIFPAATTATHLCVVNATDNVCDHALMLVNVQFFLCFLEDKYRASLQEHLAREIHFPIALNTRTVTALFLWHAISLVWHNYPRKIKGKPSVHNFTPPSEV
jgi:hypothetical protein